MKLEPQVRKLAKSVKAGPLALALGALVRKRLAKPRPIYDWSKLPRPPAPRTLAETRRRSSSQRRGKVQAYVTTGKWNSTRRGTWTHYMVDIIMDYSDTRSAEDAHAASGEYIGKRLDFGWAAKEGYIDFI